MGEARIIKLKTKNMQTLALIIGIFVTVASAFYAVCDFRKGEKHTAVLYLIIALSFLAHTIEDLKKTGIV